MILNYHSDSGRLERHKHIKQPYHLVECFCGAHAVSRGFEQQNLRTFKFDYRLDEHHNIHTKAGLLILCEALAHTDARDSLGMFEPVCSSWVYMSTGSCLRHLVP